MNRNAHETLGALVGGATAAAILDQQTDRIDSQTKAMVILGAVVTSTLASLLPDLLEPATSPNHRNHWHSLLVLLGLGALLVWLWKKKEQGTIGQVASVALAASAVAGYGSHLLADSLTPKGLPVA